MIVSCQPTAHNVNVDHRILSAFVDIAKFSGERAGIGRKIGQIDQFHNIAPAA
jgi:hypothetical protein